MHIPIKKLFFLLLGCTYIYSMEPKPLFNISHFKRTCSREKMTLSNVVIPSKLDQQEDTELLKDPRLLSDLPDEILSNVIKHTSKAPFIFFSTIQMFIRLSLVSLKFKHLNKPNAIKEILQLDQKTLDNNLFMYEIHPSDIDCAPFFKLLVTMGARMNSRIENLVSCVSQITNSYLVEYFITHYDSNVNQQDQDGYTPLRWAINRNKANIVELLLAYKANMHLADESETTPVETALMNHRVQCLEVLIKHGLDTSTKYHIDDGKENRTFTILKWAQYHGYKDMYTLITNEEMPITKDKNPLKEKISNTCIIS